MTSRLIRVSSSALGYRRRVIVRVYDSLCEMRAASTRFNGNDNSDAAAVTQAYCAQDGLVSTPVIRLARGHLGSIVVGHEMHHAATAIYGASLPADMLASDVLQHYNERFAYLFSDLLGSLVQSLYRHGYYDEPEVPR